MASLEPSAFPPIPPDIVLNTGPRIVGYLVHWGLYGVLVVQVYLYYLAFPNDPSRNKFLVYLVFLFETAQTLVVTDTAYNVLGSGYGNLNVFGDIGATWFNIPLITGIVSFIAQAFYAFRVSVLSRSKWAALVIAFLAFVQLGGSIAAAIVVKRAGSFTRLLGRDYTIAVTLWNGGGALCDIIIAGFMTYYLSRARARGIDSTNILLMRIIMLIIETGTATAVIAVVNLALSNLQGRPAYFLATSEIIAKFYSNSMMVVLNSRIRVGVDPTYSSSGRIPTAIGGGPTDGINTMSITTDFYEMGPIKRDDVAFPSAKIG